MRNGRQTFVMKIKKKSILTIVSKSVWEKEKNGDQHFLLFEQRFKHVHFPKHSMFKSH